MQASMRLSLLLAIGVSAGCLVLRAMFIARMLERTAISPSRGNALQFYCLREGKMSDQETIENDKLAAEFQDLLIKELQARSVRFTKATAVNFSDVNIDVHIYIEDYWSMYLFTYTGISWLRNRKLSEMTLETYVKRYVDRQLKELRGEVESEIKECSDLLKRGNLTESFRRSRKERLEAAQKIASWLA
jgi:hypothetical protein